MYDITGIVLAVAAVFQGLSWRVPQQELDRHRHVGESLWRASQRDMDVLVFTAFVEDSAAFIGIAIAALGVGLIHAFRNPYFDAAASVLIGLVLIASAALLAQECQPAGGRQSRSRSTRPAAQDPNCRPGL